MTARRGLVPVRYPEDRRSLLFLGALFVLFAVQWTGALRHGTLFAATCVLSFVACIVKHNHVHCRTFRVARWNRGLDHALTLATGHPTTGIITAHNVRHHGANQSADDWVRASVVNYRWNWLNLLAFPFVVVVHMRRTRPSDLREWRRTRPALYRQAVAERIVLYAVIGILLALDWRATLVWIAGPWLFGQWALITINLLQHQDCDPASAVDHSRNITGRAINWLFLNNGFHGAHHLRPALHWSRLPGFHRARVARSIRPELDQRSLAVAMWRQFFRRPARRARRLEGVA